MFCAVCRENLRGQKAVLFDGKPICSKPCGKLTGIRKPFECGALTLTGPELLRLFIEEAKRWV
jgi:hypothetical protein